MNREIKFRGKIIMPYKEQVKWIYGYLTDDDCIKSKELEESIVVSVATVGQYTGLHDKNKVEIYEEDLIKEEGKNAIYIVIYSWGAFRLIPLYNYKMYCEYKKINSMFANSFYRRTTRKFARESICFEVIGNIHDNPELLEVSQ